MIYRPGFTWYKNNHLIKFVNSGFVLNSLAPTFFFTFPLTGHQKNLCFLYQFIFPSTKEEFPQQKLF